MLAFLKNHPFAVEAFFKRSLVLTFAVPKEQLEGVIPTCLKLDTFNDQWAFIAVAIVQTKDLRPKGFPRALGNDFFLIGYRVFVRYTNMAGKRLRGLYIVKSETDKRRMQFFGNIFTHYNYTTTDIRQTANNNILEITSVISDFKLTIETEEKRPILLPEGSPFSDWKEARRFAGPLPFTFTFDASSKSVLIIEGVRENWKPKPIHVMDFNFAFLNNMHLPGIRLANAFAIENIPYHWKKGKLEQWEN